MKIPAKKQPPHLKEFWYWVNERYKIFRKREAGARKPWTKDPVLQSFRFCNVFREDDKVTKWLRDNWYTPNKMHKNLWFAACVARQINKIETLEKLGFPRGDLVKWVARAKLKLKKMKENGEKIYGGAYVITCGGVSVDKYIYTCDYVLRPIAENPPAFAKRGTWALEVMCRQLRDYLGFGAFIAYEVVSDLRWTRYYSGKDHMVWANPGPGAKRGIGRVFYGDANAKITTKECIERMQQLLAMSPRKKGKFVPDMEMRDIEHSLCEVDKYLRASIEDRRLKQRYNGGV